MRVLQDGKVSEDGWQLLGEDEPLPAAQAVLSLPRWLQESTGAAGNCYGVLLRADDDLEQAGLDLRDCPLVAVEFAAFTDGRGYSIAHAVRQAGYTGDLRAVGEIVRDQLFYLARCGFTSFAVPETADAAALLPALADFSLVYQPAADGRTFIARLRSRSAAQRPTIRGWG